ncbi:MAG: hypothetical protein ACOYBK_07155 [Bilifractor sp.]|jgi:hypothetical protein
MQNTKNELSFSSRKGPVILSGILAVLMVFVSEFLHSSEILFPEVCAILCGAWIMPRQAWNVDRKRMFLLMSTGAVFGVVINLSLASWPLAARAPLGFAFCAVMMMLTGAEMAPMFSAAVLPMLLSTDTPVYPIAVCTLIALIMIGQILLERHQIREPIHFRKNNLTKETARSWLLRCAVLCAIACPLYAAGMSFMAVPPLLVAFVELTHTDSPLRTKPVRTWLCLTLASLTGAVARNAVEAGMISKTLAAAIGFVVLIAVWDRLHVWFPPAGAILFLALLAPWQNAWVYPLETAVGAAIWIAAALLIFRNREEEPVLTGSATGDIA